ncbi:MAG: zf-TFIIB domain-containing protein [Myxococcaceae bacterium]
MSDFNCPSCKSPMKEVRTAGHGAAVQLHCCDHCHGLLIPAFGLLSVAPEKDWRLSRVHPPTEDDAQRVCPRCERVMNIGFVHPTLDQRQKDAREGEPVLDVELDECPTCGSVFFDGGELEDAAGRSAASELSGGGGEEDPETLEWWDRLFGSFVRTLQRARRY